MNLAIIFLHHNTNDITLNHLEKIKQFNPNIPIYTVGFLGESLIDGSHVVDGNQDWMPQNISLNQLVRQQYHFAPPRPDSLILDFIDKNQNLNHDKYLIIEWDTLCNTSVENFYGDSLNFDFFCNNFFIGNDIENWWWYQFFTDAQKQMQQIAAFIPISGCLFSKDVLLQMLAELKNNIVIYDNFNAETRLASLVKACNVQFLLPFNDINQYIHAPQGSAFNHKLEAAIYHPVKNEIMPILFSEHNLLGRGVEVGVHLGENACRILEEYQGTVDLIDPWINLPDEEYDDAINNGNRNSDFENCRNKLGVFQGRVNYHQKRSIEAVDSFSDESLDFVFIDGNHKYEYVKADLEAWYPKVRQGGIIAGDDYIKKDYTDLSILESNGKDFVVRDGAGNKLSTFGVNSALKEFCEARNISFKKGESWFAQWYFIKQ